jgi:hypothetical protein
MATYLRMVNRDRVIEVGCDCWNGIEERTLVLSFPVIWGELAVS